MVIEIEEAGFPPITKSNSKEEPKGSVHGRTAYGRTAQRSRETVGKFPRGLGLRTEGDVPGNVAVGQSLAKERGV